jgi:Protein of unknown function (DUF2550)
MPIWEWALDGVAAVVLVGAVLLAGLVVRRRWLSHGEATFDMSLRLGTAEGARDWTLGVGRYRGDRLEWFRVFSLALRPKRSFERTRFELVASREPDQAEAYALFAGHLVVQGRVAQLPVELALDREALTALLAWLEAAPPVPHPP